MLTIAWCSFDDRSLEKWYVNEPRGQPCFDTHILSYKDSYQIQWYNQTLMIDLEHLSRVFDKGLKGPLDIRCKSEADKRGCTDIIGGRSRSQYLKGAVHCLLRCLLFMEISLFRLEEAWAMAIQEQSELQYVVPTVLTVCTTEDLDEKRTDW